MLGPITASSAFLLAPLSYPFMQRAFLATVIVGVIAAVVGTFVVWKGLAFIGDALAHASFAGVAAAFIMKADLYIGAMLASLVTALAIASLARRGRVTFDTAIGVLFAGAFSLGIVLISRVPTYTVDLFGYVFGNVLGVGPEDVLLIAAVGAVVIGTVVLLYKELLFVAFDPLMAEATGIPVGVLQYLLLGLVALSVVAAMKAIGIVLVVAMLVTPPATASLLCNRFHQIMLLAAALSVASSVVGLYISFYANVPSGAAIVLVATALFLTVWVASSRPPMSAIIRR